MLRSNVISYPNAAMVPNELKTLANTTPSAIAAARKLRRKASIMSKVKAPVSPKKSIISFWMIRALAIRR